VGNGECRQRKEMPGGGGLKRPRPLFGCSAIEEEEEEEEKKEGSYIHLTGCLFLLKDSNDFIFPSLCVCTID